MGRDGQIQSLWTAGLALQFSLIIFTVVLISTNIKDFNLALGVFVSIISVQIILQPAIVNLVKKEYLYHEVPTVLKNGQFWLVVLATVFLLMLPYMLYRRFMALVFSDFAY